ncbi:MAG TPA: sulfurtransferase [Dehalococcoidia bacterium]|nr:sulfurtransferase [Dehalococcoidia bacterium]
MADKLLTVDWVAEHGADENVRLVEVDVDIDAYGERHIEGAVGWDWTTQLQDQTRRDILTKQGVEELLSASGIGNDTHVVLYGDNNNWFAAYALWLLELYGHENVSLMDGGRVKWLVERRPTTQAEPLVEAISYSAEAADLSLRAKRDDVLHAVGGGTQFVDVRSPAEFSGEVIAPPGMSETAQRGGHIPGAKNIPWARAVNEDGTFRSVDELKEFYRSAGLADGSTIAYCRIGERSSHTWFVLKHLLGYGEVKNYDGSWTEYGSLIDVPIEK